MMDPDSTTDLSIMLKAAQQDINTTTYHRPLCLVHSDLLLACHPATDKQLDTVRRLHLLEQSHRLPQVTRQVLQVLHQPGSLTGIEFLEETVEMFGVDGEDNGVEPDPGNVLKPPALLLGEAGIETLVLV